MALQIGIVGLPNVGKSTLFNALTRTKAAQAANYPFCTIKPNVGIVEVPDQRLAKLSDMVKPEKVIPAAIEFVDIAGLVRGASKGEGLGNAFLAAIREVDAICHVVRLFEDGDVIHVEGSVHPRRDRETIETELCLADLESCEKRLEKIRNAARTGDKEKALQCTLLEKLKSALEKGLPAKSVACLPEEEPVARSLELLTRKPMIFCCNVSEKALASLTMDQAREQLGVGKDTEVILISAKIEDDLQDLSPNEAKEFLSSLGVASSGLDQLIAAAYNALGYQTYFTAGPAEVRAWTIQKGMKAPEAAGVIHTDFAKGFIRAETISYKDFVQHGGETEAKNAGKMRIEGKDYTVADGDIMHFRFSV
jgi:GTP-binding protein YchF